jgi:acetyl esterase/lipase
MSIFLIIAIWIFISWLIASIFLTGPDLSRFDTPMPEIFDDHPDDLEYSNNFFQTVGELRHSIIKQRSVIKGFRNVRTFADNLSADLVTDTVFQSSIANNVSVEWAIAPGADNKRRILFMHGGAFIFGSAQGHRKFCDQLSKIANAAVCSVNYRMLPENGRKKGIVDSQRAYQWILENGPNGPEKLDFLMVAGDSAGGNLALMLSGWSKDHGIRKPDGVLAFSPSTDMTMSSSTIKDHRHSDKLLGEGLGALGRIPKTISAWISLFSLRMNPAHKLASPVFGNLSNLAPTLIHGSSNEMLLGEGIRYTNKAIAAGSPVKMQIWKNQMHDWHLFNMGHGSAKAAWQEVQKFIDSLPIEKA